MSFVTTARLYFGHSRRLNRSTSAVFPEPTGPAITTRNARIDVDSFSRIPTLPKTHRTLLTPCSARLPGRTPVSLSGASRPPDSRAAVYQLAEKITPKLLNAL